MAWINKEEIDLLRLNFPYVVIVVLCYVVMALFQTNGQLRTENQKVYEARIEELKESTAKERADKNKFLDLYFDYVNAVDSRERAERTRNNTNR